MNLARIGNKYLADAEPWKVIKTDPERVKTILYVSLQLWQISPLLSNHSSPIVLRNSVRCSLIPNSREQLGQTDLLAAGTVLPKPELLFEKIEDETIQAQLDKLAAIKKQNEQENHRANDIKPTIAFEDFEKLDIRVGTVTACERVPKMKKKLLPFRHRRRTRKSRHRFWYRATLRTRRISGKTSVLHCKLSTSHLQKWSHQ